MFFSMIRLWKKISLRDLAALNKGDGYEAHRLIWGLFADRADRKRDFLYRHENLKGWPTFYAVSKREPKDTSGMWEVHSKPYYPKLNQGQRLAFTLRANPIRSKRDENRRQHRHDVIMEAKTHLGSQGEKFHESEVVQMHGERWLLERCSCLGFTVSPGGLRADGYRQHGLIKGKGNPLITFSTLDFNGILTVTDPQKFVKECLFKGIGPAKGFGCGLMLVRRI